MRMLNMKRFIILFFSLIFLATGSAVYFFNVNDYSQWISKQITQLTGYDVRFVEFENNWFSDRSIAITGLSLYQQDHRVLHINKLELAVEKLDLWQRELVIKSLRLQGIDTDMQLPLVSSKVETKADTETKKQLNGLQNIAWERLYIATIQITGMNANVQYLEKTLALEDASFELNDLLLIDNQQLQVLPKQLDVKTQFEQLNLSSDTKKLQLNKVKLFVNGDVLKRQAKMGVNAELIALDAEGQIPLLFESLQVELQLEQNKLSLVNFFVNTFSGSLQADAVALLTIKLLPKPQVTVQRVTLNSLLAKDLQVVIPDLLPVKEEPHNPRENDLLPITELLIKVLSLQNVNLYSHAKQLPLNIKSAFLDVNDFYVIKNNKLVDATQLTQQTGRFNLVFDQLNWQEMQIEQLSVAGSLSEDDQGLKALKQLLSDK